MIKFCPKCGNLLRPGRGEKNRLICRFCGYSELMNEEMSLEVKLSKQNKSPKEIIVDEGLKDHVLPTAEVICPKCGNELAYWWFMQTRRADEPPTTFYRCTKCNYTWRDYR